jgi:hypothetical protein
MSVSPEGLNTAPSKTIRIWMIVLQILAGPAAVLAILAVLNGLGGIVFELIDGTLTLKGFISGIFSGLGYLIPPGLNLAAWIFYRSRRGKLALGLMTICLLSGGCALVFIVFEILKMFV